MTIEISLSVNVYEHDDVYACLIVSSFALLNFPLLKTFSKNCKISWENDIELIRKNIISDSNNSSLGLIPLCNLSSKNYSYFYEILKKSKDIQKILLSKDLIELESCDKTLLIISQNESNYNEISSLVESLKLSKINMVGWIFLEQL